MIYEACEKHATMGYWTFIGCPDCRKLMELANRKVI